MYKRKRRNKNIIIYFVVIIVLLTLIYVSANRKGNYMVVEKLFHDIGNMIEGIFVPNSFRLEDNVLEGINYELENELNDLKNLMQLEEKEYSFIYSTVIERDIDWYYELTIDKGEKDGVNVDMAVISSQGLIGRVTKTTNHTSSVKLLTSNDMKVSVYVAADNQDYYGIIDTYISEEGLILVNNVLKNSDIEVGDIVYTSGLGNVYPTGIYVGKVVEVSYDDLGLSKQLKVKANTLYDKIFYVGVVDRK